MSQSNSLTLSNNSRFRRFLDIKYRECVNIVKVIHIIVIKIQRFWRGYRVRKMVKNWHRNAIVIQKTVRGWLVRWHLINFLRNFLRTQNVVIYNRMATRIQKTFRGYLVRKKVFIKDIIRERETLKQQTNEFMEKLKDLKKQYDQRKLKERRVEIIEKLCDYHHLLRTKHIKGVLSHDNSEILTEIETLIKGISYMKYTKCMHKLFKDSYNKKQICADEKEKIEGDFSKPLYGPFVLNAKIERERYTKRITHDKPYRTKKINESIRLESPSKNVHPKKFDLNIRKYQETEPEFTYYPNYFFQ